LQLTVQVEQPLLQPIHVFDGHVAQIGVIEHRARFAQFALGLIVLMQ